MRSDGRVAIPLALKGALPKVAVLPDLTQITQAASQEAISGALQRVLGGPPPDPGEAPPGADVGGELLRRGLGGLLSGGQEE